MNRRIESLQGLRMVLFLVVFFYHVDAYGIGDPLGQFIIKAGGGGLAVCVFFVLSGFVSGLTSKEEKFSQGCGKWFFRKLKSIYPLHIIFLIVMALAPVNRANIINSVHGKLSFCLNALLLQSWVPDVSVWLGFNSVSWYLSALLLLYAMTPLLENVNSIIVVNKKRTIEKVYLGIILSMCLICIVLPFLVKDNARYWLNAFPPVRMLDYTAGFFAGKLMNKNNMFLFKSSVKTTVCEIICILLFVAAWLIFPVLDGGLNEGLCRVAIFLPTAIFAVCLLASEKGAVSKILSNKVLVNLGNKTLIYYMSHQVILRFSGLICRGMGINLPKGLDWLIIFVCLALTLVFGRIWMLFEQRIKNKCLNAR